MAQFDINQTTTTDLTGGVEKFGVTPTEVDRVNDTEVTWQNDRWTTQNGLYELPQFRSPMNAIATWVLGQGWGTKSVTDKAKLENITGRGDESFDSIIWNMYVVKKVAGDSYAKIVRNPDSGDIINLMPLNPGRIQIVFEPDGQIKEYRQTDSVDRKKVIGKPIKPQEMLHFCNDRIADSMHGTSVADRLQNLLESKNETLADIRRISHRSTIRIMYVDAQNTTKLKTLKEQYKEAIDKGELLVIPGKKTETGFDELSLPPMEAFLSYLRYIDDEIAKALNMPKLLTGGGGEGEGDSKMSHVIFEPIYVREIGDVQADLWNQLAIRVEFSPPKSLMDKVKDNEIKNTSQTGFQPNDVEAGVGE